MPPPGWSSCWVSVVTALPRPPPGRDTSDALTKDRIPETVCRDPTTNQVRGGIRKHRLQTDELTLKQKNEKTKSDRTTIKNSKK
jgi:hypothetical protein